ALLQHPLTAIGLLARRLFNGLDVQYPTPYIRSVYQPTWALAGLNYTVWFGALLVLGRTQWRKWPRARWLLLAGLLAPCLAVLPLGIECRYLLPLHLLLYATVAFGWPSVWTWHAVQTLSAWRLGLLVVGYVVFLGLCFAASAAAQATLEFGPRSLF
ncbi:MAG TPA: hypothetical protein VF690_07095, partial [Hymenobacter sp.]